MIKLKLNFKARHAGMAALMTIAVLGGLILLNLIFQNVPAQWDMTKRKLFSLTEQSRTLIGGLEKDVQIFLLAKPGQEPRDIQEVLDRYAGASSKINLDVIDPDRNPALISQYTEEGQTLSPGSVIVLSGAYSRVINRMDMYSISYSQQGQPQILGMAVEQRITSALSYVSTGKEPRLYVLEGHNEYRLEDLNLQDVVSKANYSIETLNLLREGSVPGDADVVAILSPKGDITANESEALASYLEQGGSLFVSLDLTGADMRHLNGLLERYNMIVTPGFTMEKDTNRLLPGMGNNPLFFSPRPAVEHPVTDPLKENNLDSFVFSAMSVSETEVRKRNLKFTPLLVSSKSSWLRTDLTNVSEFRSADDSPGPVTIAASLSETNRDTGEEDGARIIVLASGQSLSSLPGLGQIKANIEFFINSLNWLSEQEESINIPSKSLFRLPLQMNALQAWIYAAIVVLLIPLAIIISGSIILYRRKNL